MRFCLNKYKKMHLTNFINFLIEKKIKVKKNLLKKDISHFYRSYLKSKKDNFPFITCKLALSKDYFAINKQNKWITNEYSRTSINCKI